jgi:hypothetical protein
MLRQGSRCVRLAPKIDSHRQPHVTKVSLEGPIRGLSRSEGEMLPLHHPHDNLALSSHKVAAAIKKSCSVESFAPRNLQKTCDQVTLQTPRYLADSLLARPGKTGWKARDIHTLSPAMVEEPDGVTYVSWIIQVGIGLTLNEGDADSPFHITTILAGKTIENPR